MSGTVVSISAIDALAHRCIAAMIVRVYGSLATQRISGGQLLVLERVVVGRERFAWGLTACTDDRAVGSLSVYRYKRVCVRLDPGSLVFGEGADAAPEGSTRGTWGTRAAIEEVVHSFGFPRWWRRWPLFYGAGDTDMATDASGDTSVPLC
jgi:hypothetical protein